MSEDKKDLSEQRLVWLCYITDNYGNPIVEKAVSTKEKALEWLSDRSHTIGRKDDDEDRGHRFVESYVLKLEVEWAMIRTLFAGSRLINTENVNVDTKGNDPMDEEFLTEETIERLTEHDLKLQLAMIEAETHLANAKQKHRESEACLQDASQQWGKAVAALADSRVKLAERLGIVRTTHVSSRDCRHK